MRRSARHRDARACVLEGHDFGAWRREHRAGRRPSAYPYGLEQLPALGVEVRHSDVTHRDSPVGRLLRSRDPRLPYELRYAGALGQVLTALPTLLTSDLCLSIFERHAETYLALRRRVGRALPPLVLISCYLGEWLQNGDPALRRRAIALARGAARITVFSSNQCELLERLAGVPAERTFVIPYGIDTDFYTPAAASTDTPPFGLAVGRDAGRDWATFLAAARREPRVRLRLATSPSALSGLSVPDNVEFLGEVEHDAYRSLLRAAQFVVVPTHELGYPTGQSVLLEAMASGTPVLVTGTPAMRDYLNPAVRSYPVGDAAALAAEMADLWDDAATCRTLGAQARRVAERSYSTERMWSQAAVAIRGSGSGVAASA